MNRPLAVALIAAVVALAVGASVVLRPRGEAAAPVAPDARNPGGYVASDVARLAATGRPQLVEIFHYG